ncbi:MAG: hypothetical protein M3016_00655 [Actinomycetota bacterium]|nr:hypothetical protein [Actinomycetota bacterium]
MSIAQTGVELRSHARSRAGLSRLLDVLIPVAIVGVVLAFSVGSRLEAYGGNLTGFIQFGSNFARATHPPPGALVNSPDGYDGQFFYVQALDPLLLHDGTVNALRVSGAGFRLQRGAYPALAFILAAGQREAIPFALLAINVLVLLATTVGFAIYARRRAWPPLSAVAVALMPGMLLPALRDLSDPMALASMLAGLLLWQSGRRWPAVVALSVAVLTREVMMLAVVAVAAEAGVRAWRAREIPGAWRRTASQAWPVVVIPCAAFAVWQAYIAMRYGGPVGGAGFGLPLVNLIREARASFRVYLAVGIWDLVYLLLILAATVAALMSLRRRVTITSAGACALGLGVLVPALGDAWSDTRLSAPLFTLLLVDGLRRRNRPAVLIVTAAAAMTLMAPLGIPGSF